MKENKYDDEQFFKKYSEMDRSLKGLQGAGEWPALEKLLPDFEHKRVLDLGCGYGWHCIYAAQHHADQVIGIDLSEKMLAVARSKTPYEQVSYQRESMEDFTFADASFDIVLSSLAFHYVKDFDALAAKISRVLCKDGILIFSCEHPLFTAEGKQDWYYDEDGSILHFPVDNYFIEGERKAIFLGEEVTKYHKTLTTYLNTLLNHVFELLNIVDPKPSDEMLESVAGMKDELRRPMMLIVKARKK